MSASGLKIHQQRKARKLTLQAAQLGLHRAASLHYTQDAVARWEGIHKGLRVVDGQCPHYADCSSFATWCLWQGLGHFHLADHVNGAGWRAGYTGTLLQHGKLVRYRKAIGDLVIYGNGPPGKHVAIYVGHGMVISHGSEAGPFHLPWNYRRDVMQTRRYI